MRSKRFEKLAERPVNSETFIRPWPEVGLSAMESPLDPAPSLEIERGVVVEWSRAGRPASCTSSLEASPMSDSTVYSAGGRCLEELSLKALRRGDLAAEDFRIGDRTLLRQADLAEGAGYRQLAENFRRAAELTHLSQAQLFDIYNALRPGRATHGQLLDLAARLERDLHAPLTAAFVREAAEAYRARGIVAPAADAQ